MRTPAADPSRRRSRRQGVTSENQRVAAEQKRRDEEHAALRVAPRGGGGGRARSLAGGACTARTRPPADPPRRPRAQARRARPPARKALSRRPDRVAESCMLGRVAGKAPRAVNQQHIFGHVPGIKVGFKCAGAARRRRRACIYCTPQTARRRPQTPCKLAQTRYKIQPPRAFLRSEALVVGLHRSPLAGIVHVAGAEARAARAAAARPAAARPAAARPAAARRARAPPPPRRRASLGPRPAPPRCASPGQAADGGEAGGARGRVGRGQRVLRGRRRRHRRARVHGWACVGVWEGGAWGGGGGGGGVGGGGRRVCVWRGGGAGGLAGGGGAGGGGGTQDALAEAGRVGSRLARARRRGRAGVARRNAAPPQARAAMTCWATGGRRRIRTWAAATARCSQTSRWVRAPRPRPRRGRPLPPASRQAPARRRGAHVPTAVWCPLPPPPPPPTPPARRARARDAQEHRRGVLRRRHLCVRRPLQRGAYSLALCVCAPLVAGCGRTQKLQPGCVRAFGGGPAAPAPAAGAHTRSPTRGPRAPPGVVRQVARQGRPRRVALPAAPPRGPAREHLPAGARRTARPPAARRALPLHMGSLSLPAPAAARGPGAPVLKHPPPPRRQTHFGLGFGGGVISAAPDASLKNRPNVVCRDLSKARGRARGRRGAGGRARQGPLAPAGVPTARAQSTAPRGGPDAPPPPVYAGQGAAARGRRERGRPRAAAGAGPGGGRGVDRGRPPRGRVRAGGRGKGAGDAAPGRRGARGCPQARPRRAARARASRPPPPRRPPPRRPPPAARWCRRPTNCATSPSTSTTPRWSPRG